MRGLMKFRFLGCWVATALIASLPAAGEEPRLNVYNWSDYIAPDTIPKFEAEDGIKVTYDVYDGNEVLEAKIALRPVGLRHRRSLGEPVHGTPDRRQGLPGARQGEAAQLAEPRPAYPRAGRRHRPRQYVRCALSVE